MVDDGDLVQRIADAVAGGVDMVQLREKDLGGGEMLHLATAIKLAIGDRALLIINERADVAVASGAAGIQLGEDALPVASARRIIGEGTLIGRSVHSPEAAVQAHAEGSDFLVVGTMYASRSHPSATPGGPDLMERIAQTLEQSAPRLPLLGIGGITSANLGDVMRAGATGVAVIASILASLDPMREARALKQSMLEFWPGGTPLVGGETRGGSAVT